MASLVFLTCLTSIPPSPVCGIRYALTSFVSGYTLARLYRQLGGQVSSPSPSRCHVGCRPSLVPLHVCGTTAAGGYGNAIPTTNNGRVWAPGGEGPCGCQGGEGVAHPTVCLSPGATAIPTRGPHTCGLGCAHSRQPIPHPRPATGYGRPPPRQTRSAGRGMCSAPRRFSRFRSSSSGAQSTASPGHRCATHYPLPDEAHVPLPVVSLTAQMPRF